MGLWAQQLGSIWRDFTMYHPHKHPVSKKVSAGLVPQKAQGEGLALGVHLLAPGVGAPPVPPCVGLAGKGEAALGEGTKFNP